MLIVYILCHISALTTAIECFIEQSVPALGYNESYLVECKGTFLSEYTVLD